MRILILSAVLFICLSFSDDPNQLVGRKVPNMNVTAVDSTLVNEQFFASRTTVITFYGWGCHPCRDEIRELTSISSQFDARAFRVLIITDDLRGSILNHFTSDTADHNEKKFVIDPDKIKIVRDRKSTLHKAFAVSAIPSTFIVDNKGVIRQHILGFATIKNGSGLLGVVLPKMIKSYSEE